MTPKHTSYFFAHQHKYYNLKDKRDEKIAHKSLEIKEKISGKKLRSIIEKQAQKRRICKPIGKSVFLNTDDEKLGDIIEIISDQNNQIIGYKVKENKSGKPHLPCGDRSLIYTQY